MGGVPNGNRIFTEHGGTHGNGWNCSGCASHRRLISVVESIGLRNEAEQQRGSALHTAQPLDVTLPSGLRATLPARPMKLYYAVPSSSSRRILIALGLKRLACEGERIDLTNEAQVARLAEKSPMGQVPVLEIPTQDGPRYLSQSVAIVEYLEERHRVPPLLGTSAFERALVREVVALVTSGIQPLHNMKTLAEVARIGGDATQWTRHFVTRGLGALESLAARHAGTYMVGDSVTLADVFVCSQLDLVRLRDVTDLSAYPTLERVEARCRDIEAFAHPPEP